MSKTTKKILTVDDLIKFCQEQKFLKFSSKVTGYQLAVKIPTTFEIEDNTDKNHRGMMKLKFRIFHTGLNRNQSYVSRESAEKAMNTIADRPVLAAIHQLDSGEWDFEGHETEIITDEDGNEELKYIESQVGSFSSEPAFWETDNGKDYVCAYAYISREYTKACEIIERKQGTKNSCELFIDELSYNAKEKYLELNDFYVNASTLLGSRADGTEIQEGMEGSRADIADFSVENNSIKFSKDEKLIELLDRLNNTLSNFNKYYTEEGGYNTNMNKFEELLSKYGKTVEEITFDYAELSEDELETKFETEFGKETTEYVNPEKYSITMSDGSVKDYSLSLDEITSALYALVNNTYADDDIWYSVTVYEDNTLIMSDWYNGKYFKQSYSREDDDFSLIGDRIAVHSIWVTDEEEASLEEMRSNYAALKEFKETAEKNELHAQREEIINSEKYTILAEKNESGEYTNEAFAKLVSEMDNYSLSDLETQIKVIHSDYVAEHSNFSANSDTTNKAGSVKLFSNLNGKSKPKKRYGNLFD